MDARGPIFIIGTQGSGSTLLRLMLDSHEHIAIPQETGFMRAYNAHQWIPFKWSGRNWAKRLGWSREELDEELAAFYDRLFMRYAERLGKRRWGDKTPYHTFHVDNMARMFPEAVFVAIVRHPAATVASNISRFGHSLKRTTVQYYRYNKEIARQADVRPDRLALVRYEDLVMRPEPALRELLEWLGEPWSDSVLAHHEVQAGRGGRLEVEGQNRRDDPIDPSRMHKWKHRLDAATIATVERELGRVGEFYGYSMTDAATLAPLRADDAPLARGADIAARIDAFEDLDLRTPVEVPNADRLYNPGKLGLRNVERAPGRGPGASQAPAAGTAADRPRQLLAAARRAIRG